MPFEKGRNQRHKGLKATDGVVQEQVERKLTENNQAERKRWEEKYEDKRKSNVQALIIRMIRMQRSECKG